MFIPSARFALMGISLALLMTACASPYGESDDNSAPPVFPYVRLAPSPPPPPQIEEHPIVTEPMRLVWRRGYWTYDGQSFSWIPGDYMLKPDATAWWSPERWEKRTFGWAFIPGSWQ